MNTGAWSKEPSTKMLDGYWAVKFRVRVIYEQVQFKKVFLYGFILKSFITYCLIYRLQPFFILFVIYEIGKEI